MHSTTQKIIAEMLRSLRINTDAESASGPGCDASLETAFQPDESCKPDDQIFSPKLYKYDHNEPVRYLD